MSDIVTVGISDMKITRNSGRIITYALGSCIGICIYDSGIKLAGMVHIMLPSAPQNKVDNLYKYADTGIREMLRKMEVFGGVKRRMTAKIAGGARMFEIQGDNVLGNIGERNIKAVREVLKIERITIVGEDVGKNYARTVVFDALNGDAFIRSFGHEERKL